MKVNLNEKRSTALGSMIGGACSGALVWRATVLFGLLDSWAYVGVVLASLIGAIVGGAFADWAYNGEWEDERPPPTSAGGGAPTSQQSKSL